MTQAPPPLPSAALPYYANQNYRAQNAAITLGWLALIIGFLAMAGDAMRIGFTIFDRTMMNFYRGRPLYLVQFFGSSSIAFIAHILLAITGVAALVRNRAARQLLIAYAVAYMVSSVFSMIITVIQPFSGSPTSNRTFGITAATSSLAYIVLVVLMIVILMEPTVRQVIDDAITRPARTPGAA